MQEMKADILKLWEEKQLRITDEIQTAPARDEVDYNRQQRETA